MLNSVTWQDFALTVAVATVLYYAFVLLRYYRGDMQFWLKAKTPGIQPKVLPLYPQHLIGEAKPTQPGVDMTSGDEMEFAPDETAEETQAQSAESGLSENAADYDRLKDEVKELINYAAAAGETKEGLITLLLLYLEKAEEPYLDNLSAFMIGECHGKFGFEILPVDLVAVASEPVQRKGFGKRIQNGMLAVLAFLMLWSGAAFSQDGNSGISEATSKVRSYFDTGCDLMYAIGAVIGLIGATKVYQKWNGGDGDTGKVAASWFGSCIFLVVVATVLQSFFGI